MQYDKDKNDVNVQQNNSRKEFKKILLWGMTFAIIIAFIFAIIIAFILNNFDFTSQWTKSDKSIFSKEKRNNWVTISYGALVNKSTLTHSGETVGEIIQKITNYTDDLKGHVQQYLEPYSILCHDVLLSTIEPDTVRRQSKLD